MSGDTPTQDLDRLAAFFGERVAWAMPDDERWFGEDFTGSEVVARLRAAVEHLEYEQDYTPPTGAVSEGLRACVRAAGQACLDGEADCPHAGCVVGHQAGEILDAYDDAAADVERLTAKIDAHEALAEVQIARLTEERDAEVEVVDRTRAALGGEWGEVDGLARILVAEAARLRERVEQAIQRFDDGLTETSPSGAVSDEVVRVFQDALDGGSPTGATPSEPANAEYIAWSDGGMVGPAPGHGEPACSRCKGTGVTRSVSVDMSGKPGPPSRCPCTVEPGGEK